MNNRIIDKISGFLKAFEWMNKKSNNGYSFEITALPKFSTSNEAVQYYAKNNFTGCDDMSISITDRSLEWQTHLNKLLAKWLFDFQVDTFNDGRCLFDKHKDFSLSVDSFKEQMIDELMNDFGHIAEFDHGYAVNLNFEKSFYECSYDDFLLMGKEGSLFIHFGVSD